MAAVKLQNISGWEGRCRTEVRGQRVWTNTAPCRLISFCSSSSIASSSAMSIGVSPSLFTTPTLAPWLIRYLQQQQQTFRLEKGRNHRGNITCFWPGSKENMQCVTSLIWWGNTRRTGASLLLLVLFQFWFTQCHSLTAPVSPVTF